MYIGEWFEGKKHGNGIKIKTNGDRFKGYYVNN